MERDPDLGVIGTRLPTEGRVWVFDIPADTAVVVDLASLGIANRWIAMRATGNEVAYLFRDAESTTVPSLSARDTLNAEGAVTAKNAQACDSLADGDPDTPGFPDVRFPILVFFSAGAAAVVRLKDAQIKGE